MSINPDFENLRIALMNSYNTQTVAHIGYLITVAVAISALLYEREKLGRYFPLALSFLAGILPYLILRTTYWAWMGGTVLKVTQQQAIDMNRPTMILGIQDYLVDFLGKLSSTNPISEGVLSAFSIQLAFG